ncbi:MAG: polysaccharide pyruvyl transferase family protein [Candidatus Obscuribacterales bacterium]|nr:polysaccharide pyruvyl transferase family protein [Candidatus Obscuribacterales bacterium]
MKSKAGAPSQIFVVNCWHDSNKGDAAINIGLLNALVVNRLTNQLKLASYAIYSTDEAETYAFRHVKAAHPEAEVVTTAVPGMAASVGHKAALQMAFRGLIKLIIPGLLPDKPMESVIRESSAVVSTGGLYFGFVKGSFADQAYHLFALSYPMLFARRIGVPYVLYAQSFGPFHGRFARWWMRRLVSNSAGTWSRESFSQEMLRKLGAKPERLKVVADAAFGIRVNPDCEAVDLSHYGLTPGAYVALSLRGLGSAGHDKKIEENYRTVFQCTVEWLVREKDLNVVLMAHTIGPYELEDDRGTTEAVWKSLSSEVRARSVLILDDLGPNQLAQLYGAAKFVIATRFHAAVLAICGGSPIVAIPYFGLKTQGSLRDLGLADFVIELGSLTLESVQQKCNAILSAEIAMRDRIQAIAQERYKAAMQTGEDLGKIIAATSNR